MASVSILRTDDTPQWRNGQIILNISNPEISLDMPNGERLNFLESGGVEISYDGKNFYAKKGSLIKKIG